jgi:hypothetical protein
MPRGTPNTEASVTRTANSEHTSLPNLFGPNPELSYADEPVSQNGYMDVHEKSAYTYQFHTGGKHHHPDSNNQVYRYGNDHWPMNPQMDDYAFQMEIVPSEPGDFREAHSLQPAEGPQNDFPLASYVEDPNANEVLDALDLQKRDNLDSRPVLQFDRSQESYVPLFQSWSEDSFHRQAPSHLALLSEQEALRTIVPRDPSCSLRPHTILALYPSAGYDSVSDIHAVGANAQITELSAEIGHNFGSQPALMLNYDRSPYISVFPPLAERTQHVPNGVDKLPVLEESSDISLESHQSVWDVTTGDLVLTKTKRSLSNEERAHSQTIRSLGGQCKKCRKGKRKVCVSLVIDCPVSH